MYVSPFQPELLIPVVLARRAPAGGPVPGGKVGGQQVEEDARRRHNCSQSRQGAHVAPLGIPPLAAFRLCRKVAPIKVSGVRRRETLRPLTAEKVDVLICRRRTPRKRSDLTAEQPTDHMAARRPLRRRSERWKTSLVHRYVTNTSLTANSSVSLSPQTRDQTNVLWANM